MFMLPESGVRRSRSKHNCELQLFCDWIEACVLFNSTTPYLSRTDIVDVLCEESIYDDQGFASDWLDNVWAELRRRQKLLEQVAPFDVRDRAVARTHPWDQVPAYSFCLMVPLLQRSAGWLPRQTEEQRAEHYRRQGSLFEQVSEEALKTAGWLAHRTGWSSEDAERLPSVVASVASTLGELEHSHWVRNVSPRANEAGLDMVFFRPFPDGRCGFPIYLAQCASGADWDTKLHTPVLAVWSKMIDFAAPPSKAFILPHSLGADRLRRVTVKVQGIVLDRYRLHGSLPLNWCGSKLVKELKAFLKPLIVALPSYD